VTGERGEHEPPSSDELFATLYAELHRLAERQLRRAPGLSLGATTLLHDAYLHLTGRDASRFADRAHFLGYAARAMRHLVIDYARRAQAMKRGGGMFEITLTEHGVGVRPNEIVAAAELERLSDALDELSAIEKELAQLVDLHFFCGFSFKEIAVMRQVSERTVQRDWRKARMLLHGALTGG
jgi:RNA polymerase sigma factor (TIGR02999 family)